MNILLVQTSFLGDTILATPVIAGIHKSYPDARLYMMTTPESVPLVARDPLLEGVLAFDKRKNESGIQGIFKMARKLNAMKFDRAYALHRSFRTALVLKLAGIPERIGFSDASLAFLYSTIRPRPMRSHEVLRNLSILSGDISLKNLETGLRLFGPAGKKLSVEVRNLLPPESQYAVLVPGSVWNTKMWHWEGFRETATYLLKRKIPVVLDGSPKDRLLLDKIGKDLDVVNLAGISGIADVLYIIEKARLLVCNDSMALHVASAFKTPTVAVFCATSPSSGFYPWKNLNAVIVEKQGLSCRPCGRHGGKRCPTGTYACIRQLPPGKVIATVERLLP